MGAQYNNLITCDVVCRAVPSPGLWDKYINHIREQFGNFADIAFREKVYGYSYSNLVFKNQNGKYIYSEGIESDPYMRAFFSDTSVRPSCYKCSFKKRYRKSDFTIWDCFSVYRYAPEMDDDSGATRLIIHSEKGRVIFDKIAAGLNYKRIDVDDLVDDTKEMLYSVKYNSKRENFFKDYGKLDFEKLMNIYFARTILIRIEKKIRIFCARIGIYRVMLRIYKKFRNGDRNRYR